MPKRTNESRETALVEQVRGIAGASSAQLEARLQGLWGGYGELLRVVLNGSRRVIVKHVQPPPDDGSLSHRRKLRSYEVERAFYTRYAALCREAPEARVAGCYGAVAANGGWLFVLEDLDASGFSQRRVRASDAEIRATLGWLARFHARFLGVAPDELWKVGTYWHLATRPGELRALADPALRRAAVPIDAELNRARFQTFVHGDAKLENVCFSASTAEVALVDFQYVGGGVGVKDVAYFLSSCLGPSECEPWVPVYLEHYFGELKEALGAARAAPVEREWRSLFPSAWVDFYRFYAGWAAQGSRGDSYGERLAREVLVRLRCG